LRLRTDRRRATSSTRANSSATATGARFSSRVRQISPSYSSVVKNCQPTSPLGGGTVSAASATSTAAATVRPHCAG
jgi:hypothetical protein